MKKKYPIRQREKIAPDAKNNSCTFTPPARQRVAFFRRCGKRGH